MGIELGRYYYSQAEVVMDADAAALAAAAEINQRVFEESGDLTPTSQTRANVQAFGSLNDGYLLGMGTMM